MKQLPMKAKLLPVKLLSGAALMLALGACRGNTSESPPVHLVLDMDFQPKLKAQSESHFPGWTDHRGMRLPLHDATGRTIVVARGSLPDEKLLPDAKNPGKGLDGAYIAQNPLPLTAENLRRGRERFDINCSICHGYSGRGGNGDAAHGMVGRRWPGGVKIPSFHVVEGADNRVANLKDGEYFEVISNGKTTMPAYGARITVEDRWAIVHYLRALKDLGRQ